MRTSFQQSSSILGIMRSLVIILPLLVIMLGTVAEGGFGPLCKAYDTPWKEVRCVNDLQKFDVKCAPHRILKSFNLVRKYRRHGKLRGEIYKYRYRCCKGPIVETKQMETDPTIIDQCKPLTPLTFLDVQCNPEDPVINVLNRFKLGYTGEPIEPPTGVIWYDYTCKELNREPTCKTIFTKSTLNTLKYLPKHNVRCPGPDYRYMSHFQLKEDILFPVMVYYEYTCCGF